MPGVAQTALLGLMFAIGARTPLVAFMAFRRQRNVVGLFLPQALFAVAAIAVAPILASDVGRDLAVGTAALAAAPGLVRGERFAEALGGSRDAAAALFTGTLLVTLLIVEPALGRFATVAGPGIGGAALALGGGAALAAMLPTVRDLLLAPLRWAETIFAASLAATTAIAALSSGPSPLWAVAAAGGVLVLGTGGALVASWIGGARAPSVVAGAGTRDPGIAGAFCLSVSDPAAAAVPLAYGLMLLAAATLAIAARRVRAVRT